MQSRRMQQRHRRSERAETVAVRRMQMLGWRLLNQGRDQGYAPTLFIRRRNNLLVWLTVKHRLNQLNMSAAGICV
eukprot:2778187-Pleurochrysis_carterae.AAC.2